MQGIQKRALKTKPHAEIGYLVGYDLTNIFRIWIPSKYEVRRVRDVTFDEETFYKGSDIEPIQQVQRIEVQLPQHIENESDYEDIDLSISNRDESTIIVNTTDQIYPSSQEGSQISSQEDLPAVASSPNYQDLYNIPTPSPTASIRDSQQPEPRRSQRIRKPAASSFHSYQDLAFHSSFSVGRLEKPHRRNLPLEPRYWKELESYPYGPEFKQAAKVEFNSLENRGIFKPIQASQIEQDQ
jgi:hypothetical protein